uniref:PI-PLC Y-box domain-containing protein n=1 Tax=Heterorhabditis bacteriophora TaxID=37862 RepID=A0A1I7WN97_HETBA
MHPMHSWLCGIQSVAMNMQTAGEGLIQYGIKISRKTFTAQRWQYYVSASRISTQRLQMILLGNFQFQLIVFGQIMVGGNGADFCLATKYSPNSDVIIRAKLNNNSQVALAVTHSLSPALKLTLSTLCNLTTNESHKFGLGLEFNPSN